MTPPCLCYNRLDTLNYFLACSFTSTQAISHLGVGTGIFFAVLLIIGIIGLIGYAYFRFKQGDIRFQRFKQKNDIDVTTLDTAQISNISNINYESSRTSPPDLPYDPFLDSDVRELVTNEPPAEL
ncbi:UNVERIFIED_CONTAM: hypothetical protein K2H54_074842 [Gekko kuhli]